MAIVVGLASRSREQQRRTPTGLTRLSLATSRVVTGLRPIRLVVRPGPSDRPARPPEVGQVLEEDILQTRLTLVAQSPIGPQLTAIVQRQRPPLRVIRPLTPIAQLGTPPPAAVARLIACIVSSQLITGVPCRPLFASDTAAQVKVEATLVVLRLISVVRHTTAMAPLISQALMLAIATPLQLQMALIAMRTIAFGRYTAVRAVIRQLDSSRYTVSLCDNLLIWCRHFRY